jgi:GNAT superfamily N-acetyltransferase
MLKIRAFTDADYEAIAAVYNAAMPEDHHTAEGLRHEDETRDPKCKHACWVVEHQGRVVGVAEYDQFSGMYHPRKFFMALTLVPEHDAMENRTVLWDQVRTALEPFEPLSILSDGREDRRVNIEFLESQGFIEVMRYWESRLDVNTFDFTPHQHVQAEVEAAGFEIKTLAELQADPEYKQKFYDMWVDCRRDVPRPDEVTEVSFERFCVTTFDNPYLLPEASFFALEVATNRWAGMSQLWKGEGEDINLHTGLTAVRREYRRNRLALAMKLRGIEYARRAGSPEIRTGNEANNRGMLAINEMLGFVKQPAWLDLVKVLRD